jgi:hypothetical protein
MAGQASRPSPFFRYDLRLVRNTMAGNPTHARSAAKALMAALLISALAVHAARAQNPSTIYVYDPDQGSNAHDSLMASLAGVVARTAPEIAFGRQFSSSVSDPEFWIDQYIAANPGSSKVFQTSVPWYIDRYKDKLSGYVVYDSEINEATSVAGALGAIMVHQSLLSGAVGTALSAAGLQQVEDVRGRNTQWVYNNYGAQLNKDMIFRQQPQFASQLRDLAVLNAGLIFNETGALRDTLLAGQNDHSMVYGWGYNNNEEEFFGSASQHNLMGAPADHLQSAAAASRWQVAIPQQAAHTPTNITTQAGSHYVAFVMSDGDNVQWLTNDFARDVRWFGSPFRGDFDFTFDVSPALNDVNPVALKYLYEQAAGDEHKTFFVTPGGKGLNYPSQTPDIDGFMDVTAPAMTAVDHNIISVLDDTVNLNKLHDMVDRPEVMGLMLKTGGAYKGQNGAIYWHQGKPIVAAKYSLWDGFDSPNEIISALNSAPTNPLTNEASYTIVNVHPWSTSLADGGQGTPMANVNHIVQNLNPNVRTVTLEELFIHLRNNFGSVVDPGFGQDLVRNGDFEVLANGSTTRPADWFYDADPGATQLVAGQDSDGDGQRAAAINQLSADWRSAQITVTAGEELEFSFDFKMTGVPAGSGFRADARFFGSGGNFLGETTRFFDAASYTPGEWHSFSTIAVVPDGAPIGDLRFSTFFGPFAGGQVLIDNVSLLRRKVIGDFDDDGDVDADDLTSWRADFGQTAGSDADGDGDSDGADFLAWQRNLGTNGSPVAPLAAAVPEPASATIFIASLLTALMIERLKLRATEN